MQERTAKLDLLRDDGDRCRSGDNIIILYPYLYMYMYILVHTYPGIVIIYVAQAYDKEVYTGSFPNSARSTSISRTEKRRNAEPRETTR